MYCSQFMAICTFSKILVIVVIESSEIKNMLLSKFVLNKSFHKGKLLKVKKKLFQKQGI